MRRLIHCTLASHPDMSAITQQIQSLLSPPDASTSQARTLEFINATFPSWDALNEPDVLDRYVETAAASSSELGRKVSSGAQRRRQ